LINRAALLCTISIWYICEVDTGVRSMRCINDHRVHLENLYGVVGHTDDCQLNYKSIIHYVGSSALMFVVLVDVPTLNKT
jgi:hypothetical protein